MRNYLFILIPFFVISLAFSAAYAHTTIQVEQYEIEIGWGEEPPVVGFMNHIVFEISESPSAGVKSGIINAFKNLQATAKFGGVTKNLDINSDPRPGHYFSKIIPTRTGSIVIELKGDINGVVVDEQIPVEDVETRAALDFPPSSGSSSEQEVSAMKNALSSLQKDVTEIKSKVGGVSIGSGDINVESAYNFGIFGLSLGAAGVILAIIAMIKRK